MFEILSKYVDVGEFIFGIDQSLRQVCNAPNNKSGIYLLYDNSIKNNSALIYIGRSGQIDKDGEMFIRKSGLGGMRDRIVNGHQFGKIPRYRSWPKQMELDKINNIYINWFVTHSNEYVDCPRQVEKYLLKQYFNKISNLPRWNRSF